jgi:protein-L-isoaspartate(D-aspartate) O-methyltransferase
MDFETQRKNMVESQVRPSDVTDRRIIRAMLAVPREAFVPESMAGLAYMDADVSVAGAGRGGTGRALLAPRTFARLVDLARIEPEDAVLDIGTATGYSAAVMAEIGATVVALECDERLARQARSALDRLGIANVTVVTGGLAAGWPGEGPYDAIVLEGAVPEVPAMLLEQLKDGGRLVAVLARGRLGKAAVWRRIEGTFDVTLAFDAGAPLLPDFETAPVFAF